ncbi:MAG: M3 family metallopeptidase [Anaeromyxobacteraceae bacterium]|nr:M3 family metallopeptidase [Anaeromyxobacteraceae bacterium]
MNPLLATWTGPYGGVPPFAAVKVEHFKPALEAGMAAQLAAIEKITAETAPATFENTIAAMERSGRTLDRVGRLYGVWSSTLSTPDFQAVETEMAPKLAAFSDQITQNPKLFARIAAVYEAREKSGLTPEQQRVTWLYYTNFVRAGARLDAAAKARVAAINERLASLFTAFTQHVLAEEGEQLTLLEGEADLAGLSATTRAGYAEAAEARGHKGKWAVPNTRSAVEPFLQASTRRDLREKVWRAFVTRGDHGDARDNKAAITEILKLRAERAKLLGYATHAHWSVENSMAKTPERAMTLMEAVWPAAAGRVREEVADMQAVADKEGAKLTIEPWDYRFYAEKVRKAKYDLDEGEVKPYLQLEKLREGMFWVAGEIFDLHFTPVTGLPVNHPDVRVWEVKDGAGKHVGLWYFDPYARQGKQSGAWMNAYRDQERFDGEITTIVSNNSNFVKGKPGEPVLVSWTDAETLFHEFGHALHGLCANATYPSVSGTNVARDYVEFPSQILERWLETPEVLNRFAVHATTGKPIPAELLKKIQKASKFNQGFATMEYLASALVDMKAHLAGEKAIEPAAFEKETLAALGMPREVVMRHRLPHFQHIFAGDGYSAGYYSYLWADTISADAFEAFTEGKGPYDKAVAARLKKFVFSAGNAVDPAEGYRAFRGKDAGTGALMRKRGFPEVKGPAAPAK